MRVVSTASDHRVLVCGSRGWTDIVPIRRVLQRFARGTVVIHGGARGADTLAGRVAHALGHRVEVYLADWQKDGRAAGLIRNQRMLDEGKPTCLYAFNLGTPGTEDMVRRGWRRAGLLVVEITPFGETAYVR